MTSSLIVDTPATALALAPLPEGVQRLLADAHALAVQSSAPNTLRAYRRAWSSFEHWLRGQGLRPTELAADYQRATALVMAFLTSRATKLRPSSLRQLAAGIAHAFFTAGVDPNPARASSVKLLLRGVEHKYGSPPVQKAALRTVAVVGLLATCDRTTLQGKRDAAVILTGFAGAFRRSELTAVEVPHLRFEPEGVAIFVPRHKADATGKGRCKGIKRGQRPETCPVTALQEWMAAAKVSAGPVFRGLTKHGTVRDGALSDGVVADIVKRAALLAKLDPKTVASHSLRAGFVTEMMKQKARDEEIMEQTFHGSKEMLRTYYREARLFENSPTELLGL